MSDMGLLAGIAGGLNQGISNFVDQARQKKKDTFERALQELQLKKGGYELNSDGSLIQSQKGLLDDQHALAKQRVDDLGAAWGKMSEDERNQTPFGRSLGQQYQQALNDLYKVSTTRASNAGLVGAGNGVTDNGLGIKDPNSSLSPDRQANSVSTTPKGTGWLSGAAPGAAFTSVASPSTNLGVNLNMPNLGGGYIPKKTREEIQTTVGKSIGTVLANKNPQSRFENIPAPEREKLGSIVDVLNNTDQYVDAVNKGERPNALTELPFGGGKIARYFVGTPHLETLKNHLTEAIAQMRSNRPVNEGQNKELERFLPSATDSADQLMDKILAVREKAMIQLKAAGFTREDLAQVNQFKGFNSQPSEFTIPHDDRGLLARTRDNVDSYTFAPVKAGLHAALTGDTEHALQKASDQFGADARTAPAGHDLINDIDKKGLLKGPILGNPAMKSALGIGADALTSPTTYAAGLGTAGLLSGARAMGGGLMGLTKFLVSPKAAILKSAVDKVVSKFGTGAEAVQALSREVPEVAEAAPELIKAAKNFRSPLYKDIFTGGGK